VGQEQPRASFVLIKKKGCFIEREIFQAQVKMVTVKKEHWRSMSLL